MSVFTIQAPDGRKIKIEAADEATAMRGAQEWSKANPKKTKRNVYGEVAGFMANVNRGLGIGDELAAGARTAGNVLSGKVPVQNVVSDFKTSMERQRETEDSYAADRPKMAALGRGTGMAATVAAPIGPSANMLAATTRVGGAAKGALAAGTTAAGYAAADRGTVSERVTAAQDAATNPLVLGLGAVGGAAAVPKARTPKPAKAPTLDELRAQKNAAYGAVEASGVRYGAKEVDDLVGRIEKDVTSNNISASRHPKAQSMLDDIKALRGKDLSLTELDQLRQVIRRDVANSKDDAERFFGQRMIAELDDFIDNTGNGGPIVKTARDLNTRVRKIEAVNDAVESARLRAGSTGSGGNANNATRQNLRRVMEQTRNLTPAERAAMEDVVVGSKGQNLLRQVGKLSPEGNGLMTAFHLGALVPTGGLSGVAAVGGAISKLAADAMTKQKVANLVDLMARGGQAAVQAEQELARVAATDPAIAAIYRQVAAMGSRASGVSASVPAQSNALAASR